jgi:hypothetical protein
MAVEAKRGCGYRRVGGLYVVSGPLGSPCGRLPMELSICPTCHSGIHQARGWTWVHPAKLLENAGRCFVGAAYMNTYCSGCPASPAGLMHMGERAGLLWVGGQFYPEAEDFMREARELGVSRRLSALPRGLDFDKHWVLIAHPRAVFRKLTPDEITSGEFEDAVPGVDDVPWAHFPGVITLFRPRAIEKIVTETQSKDELAMSVLAKRGITPVVVPDDDPDHQGSVHDKPKQEELL